MTANLSPALQALLQEQADAFKKDVENALTEMDPMTFYRWAADRQYADAAKFANAARRERQAPKPVPTVAELIAAQRVNGNRNTCDCVHCAPHLRAVHGNGCSGYHCSGSCISVPLDRCGRCGAPNRLEDISATGPYRTCPACTDIIRN